MFYKIRHNLQNPYFKLLNNNTSRVVKPITILSLLDVDAFNSGVSNAGTNFEEGLEKCKNVVRMSIKTPNSLIQNIKNSKTLKSFDELSG